MESANEIELHRLADMLHSIDESLERTSPLREALQKAGISLALGFMHGMRPDIERHYQQLGTPLTEVERAHLRSLGIEPDASNDETPSA